MTRKGLAAARALGTKLPRFRSSADARRALQRERDRCLAELRALVTKDCGFVADETPESLRALEAWYFALVARRGFARLGTDRARCEAAMGYYFGAVAAGHAKARWVVQELAFAPGTYEIGVTKGRFSLMGIEALCEDWRARPNNKAHRALARQYAEYFASAPRRVSQPKPTDDAIEAEVLRVLDRKSRPSRYPFQLADDVRSKLGLTRAKLSGDDVARVLAAMVRRRRIVRVVNGGSGHYSVSYQIADRGDRPRPAKRRAP